MPRATKDDAHLIIELAELGQTDFSREARRWLFSEFSAKDYEEFIRKYPQGSLDHSRITNIMGFFELAGALVSRGLLNEDLFFDLGFGLQPVWGKVAPIIPGWQKATTPAFWENLVWLANRAEFWSKKVWKPKVKSAPAKGARR